MAAIIGQIKFAADTIAVAPPRSRRATAICRSAPSKQAASLEETAVSMKAGRDRAAHRDQRTAGQSAAGGAADVAARGGNVVHEVVETMAVINASSRRIVDIIGVIDASPSRPTSLP